MLVGSGMKYHARTPGVEDLRDPGLIADIGHARYDIDVRKFLQKMSMDVEQAIFGLLDQEQSSRAKPAKLSAQLRADAAAGAAHKDGSSFNDSCDGLIIQIDGVS